LQSVLAAVALLLLLSVRVPGRGVLPPPLLLLLTVVAAP
jgi:hypothetical protein